MEPLRRIFGWRLGFGNKDIEAVGTEHLHLGLVDSSMLLSPSFCSVLFSR